MRVSDSEKIMPKKHQIKSSRYYWFWGLCTIAVCAGQIYVGSGYRQMSRSFNRIVDAIVVEIEIEGLPGSPRRKYRDHPMLVPLETMDPWDDQLS